MEYNSYKNIKYYKECAALVEGMGYKLVDLKIVPAKSITKISAIICSCDPAVNIGVNDCAKVHRVLLPRLEALLGTEETSMELTSPGIEHNIKNAAEFEITEYLKPGDNLFAFQTFRWCDGTYSEDQDFWRLSGTARDS